MVLMEAAVHLEGILYSVKWSVGVDIIVVWKQADIIFDELKVIYKYAGLHGIFCKFNLYLHDAFPKLNGMVMK